MTKQKDQAALDRTAVDALTDAVEAALSEFQIHAPNMSGKHTYRINLVGERANDLRAKLAKVLEAHSSKNT